MTYIEDLKARVEKGAGLLDQERPGWIDRLDLDHLNLSNPFYCVLGQEFSADSRTLYDSGYELALYELFEGIPPSIDGMPADEAYGFCAGPADYRTCEGDKLGNPWELMQATWTSYIEARRAEASR